MATPDGRSLPWVFRVGFRLDALQEGFEWVVKEEFYQTL